MCPDFKVPMATSMTGSILFTFTKSKMYNVKDKLSVWIFFSNTPMIETLKELNQLSINWGLVRQLRWIQMRGESWMLMISRQFFSEYYKKRERERWRDSTPCDCFQVSGSVKMQNIHLSLHHLAAADRALWLNKSSSEQRSHWEHWSFFWKSNIFRSDNLRSARIMSQKTTRWKKILWSFQLPWDTQTLLNGAKNIGICILASKGRSTKVLKNSTKTMK